jgi:hypothetical protein
MLPGWGWSYFSNYSMPYFFKVPFLTLIYAVFRPAAPLFSITSDSGTGSKVIKLTDMDNAIITVYIHQLCWMIKVYSFGYSLLSV